MNAVLRKVAALPKTRAFDAEQAYPRMDGRALEEILWRGSLQEICEQGQTEPETALRLLGDDAEEMLAVAWNGAAARKVFSQGQKDCGWRSEDIQRIAGGARICAIAG